MVAFTPNRGYPYSTPTDPAEVYTALEAFARAVDTDVFALSQALNIRPCARFVGATPYIHPSPNGSPQVANNWRLPMPTTHFDLIGITKGSQVTATESWFRPTVPGFYFVVATLQLPVITFTTLVDNLRLELESFTGTPAGVTSQQAVQSVNIGVNADDANVKTMSVAAGMFINGTTGSIALKFQADTTPDVASYTVSERTLTILRMTES